jgi:tetratricopeptide (TPR) repeat protein
VDAATAFTRAAQSGDWPAALRAADALLRRDPASPALHYNRGLVLRRLGRLDEAVAAHEAALARSPDHANARFERAACLLDLGRLAAVEAGFADYLAVVPGDADARLNRARIRLRLGNPEGALADTEDLAEGPPVRLARAEAMRDLGRLDEAEALLTPRPGDGPDLRAAALKLLTQGASGRVRLAPRRPDAALSQPFAAADRRSR